MNRDLQYNRQQIAEEAAEWFVRMREESTSPQARKELTAWLLDSPVHVREYLAAARLWGDCAHIDPDKKIAIASLLPSDDVGSNVVPLSNTATSATNIDAGTTRHRSRTQYVIAAGIAAVAVTLISLFWNNQTPPLDRYITGIGEQRSIALADGSIIELNTRSELIVEPVSKSRRVRLIKGEAFFDVKKDPNRPFVVDTGDAQVQVTGTRFNVYKKESGTAVTVLEGKVSVARIPDGSNAMSYSGAGTRAASEPVKLSVGEQARILPHLERIETVTANIKSVIAWQDRRLAFEAQSLDEIVAEFNRYNMNRIEVGDATLAGLKLSGIFESNDPDSLIEYLQRIRDVRVITQSDGSRVIMMRSTYTR